MNRAYEHERAEYRLARSLLQAGAHAGAAEAARRCLAVCDANDAPPFERYFGWAAFALAQRQGGDRHASEASRQHARAQYAMIAADERQWCEAEQKDLEG